MQLASITSGLNLVGVEPGLVVSGVTAVAVGQLGFNRSQSEPSGWAYEGGSGSGAKGARLPVAHETDLPTQSLNHNGL